jgi:UrcA family protein
MLSTAASRDPDAAVTNSSTLASFQEEPMRMITQDQSPSPSAPFRCRLAVTVLSLAAAAALCAGTAAAQQKVSLKVNVSDLDLRRPADRKLAEQRIKAGARRLCIQLMDSGSVAVQETYQDCVKDAVTAAIRDLDTRGIALASQ